MTIDWQPAEHPLRHEIKPSQSTRYRAFQAYVQGFQLDVYYDPNRETGRNWWWETGFCWAYPAGIEPGQAVTKGRSVSEESARADAEAAFFRMAAYVLPAIERERDGAAI